MYAALTKTGVEEVTQDPQPLVVVARGVTAGAAVGATGMCTILNSAN